VPPAKTGGTFISDPQDVTEGSAFDLQAQGESPTR